MPILHWLTREQDTRAASRTPYRLLEEDRELSAGAAESGNILIQGDNLEALKALLPFYAGRVKCIYIDPPYNTRYAHPRYDDSLEHTKWLAMTWPRLELLRELMLEEGPIWISIDDREGNYLKVICDEIFGRSRFMGNIVWQKRYSRDGREALGDAHEHVLCYAVVPKKFKEVRNFLPLGDRQRKVFRNPNDDPRGPWQSVSLLAQGYRPNQMYEITASNGRVQTPPPGNCWKVIEPEFRRLLADNRIHFGRDGNGVPRRIHFLRDTEGLVPWTWWPHEDAGHTGEAKNEVNALFGVSNTFDTPKPERLIHQILTIATNPGDLVLDSFLGSGTTAAVAHKMGWRWIGIEMGEHAVTHCAPRLRKVIEGEQGGISDSVGRKGGGRVPLLSARAAGIRRGWAHPAGHPLSRARRARVVQRDGPAVGRERRVSSARPARWTCLRTALQRRSGRPAAGRRERVDAANPFRDPNRDREGSSGACGGTYGVSANRLRRAIAARSRGPRPRTHRLQADALRCPGAGLIREAQAGWGRPSLFPGDSGIAILGCQSAKLKEYQAETLAVLRRFFEEARVAGPRNAYEAITRAPEQAERLGRYAGAYTPLLRLQDVPYVCLRLPTGGGKTILAAHAVAIARDAWIEKDHPLVLWLVPSNTIRIQTVQALKNTRHPYRQALDESFSGRVRVFDITDFSHVRPPDLRDHCCVVVGTIQTLRSQTPRDARYTPTTRILSPTSPASRRPCPASNGCRMGVSSSPSRTYFTCTAR